MKFIRKSLTSLKRYSMDAVAAAEKDFVFVQVNIEVESNSNQQLKNGIMATLTAVLKHMLNLLAELHNLISKFFLRLE